MKDLHKKIIATLFSSLLLTPIFSAAHELPSEKMIQVRLNGEKIYFEDQQPVIQTGRTLVPARSVFEKMGAEVLWDDETKTVTIQKEERHVQITIGSHILLKDGEEITIDVPAEILNDRTMLPLRAVTEAMDCYIAWARTQNTAHIYTKSSSEARNKLFAYRFGLGGPFWTYDIFETTYGTVIQDILAYAPHRTSYNLYIVDSDGNIKNLDEAVPRNAMHIHPMAEYLALWGDEKTLTYSVFYDKRASVSEQSTETDTLSEKVYYEAGTYYFRVDLETGECVQTHFEPREDTGI